MSKKELANTADLICNLKAATAFLECQQNMISNDQKKNDSPSYVIVPLCDNNKRPLPRNKPRKCKSKTVPTKIDPNINVKREGKCPPKYKSPEMKMSYLHYKCFCLHRNGLQDECPLTLCQGQPQCLVQPWAECPPGKYFRAKNPELYPPNPKLQKKSKRF